MQEELDDFFSLLPAKYIRPEEKGKIKFTKEGIIEFVYKLQLLEFINKFEQDGIKISIRDNSELNKENCIYRIEMEMKKSFFRNGIPTIKELVSAFKDPIKLKRWDDIIKEYIILEKISDKTDIVKVITNEQFNMIPEMEYIDKRICFFDEGQFYGFSSSVPDSIFPISDDIIRAEKIMRILVIKEDKNFFYFDIFSQVDIKMYIPQTNLLMNLPMKIKEYFEKLVSYFN